MGTATPHVRAFTPAPREGSVQLGDHEVFLTPAVQEREGRGFSAYWAFAARSERADLPAPCEEVWVVVTGRLRITSGATVLSVTEGMFVHIPEDSPGQVDAVADTVCVCVSVPGH